MPPALQCQLPTMDKSLQRHAHSNKSLLEKWPDVSTDLSSCLDDSVRAQTIKSRAIKLFNEQLSKDDRLQIPPDMRFNDVLSEAQSALQYVGS